MAVLIVKKNNQIIKEFQITKPRVVIGRGVGADVEISDKLSSRNHCEIQKQGEHFIINDLKSADGTFLNNNKITSAFLKNNDEITIGQTILLFEHTPQVTYASGDIVRKINEIPLEYRLNIKEMQKAGESLAAAPFSLRLEESKDSKKFFILYQLGKAVTSATTLEEVLDITMYSIFDFIKADRGIIMLIDKKTGSLVPQLSRDRVQGNLKEHLKVSQTIVNKVVQDKVSIITTDAMADERFSAGMSIVQQHIRSALCVPLWEKQDVLGVIYIDNLLQSHCFTSDDIDLLGAFANQVAIRIKQDELFNELNKEALLRGNLERFHSPDVVEMIVSRGGVDFVVDERDITVLFADIQNFTTLSEKNSPSRIAQMLNEFFENSTQIIFEHKGSVNKYIGDEIMAIFGAPFDQPEHAINATRCAMKIIQSVISQKGDDILRYNVRIGVNSGMVVAGNIGSKKRIEYTVLGDTVNIASRISKFGETNQIVIGEQTYQSIKPYGIPVKDLGLIQLKGKEKEIKVYQVIV
jgi:adenylate cyclase